MISDRDLAKHVRSLYTATLYSHSIWSLFMATLYSHSMREPLHCARTACALRRVLGMAV